MTLAKTEAKLLHEKISDKEYNNEDVIRILSTRSKAQISATLNQYRDHFGNDITKVSVLSYLLFYIKNSYDSLQLDMR